MLQKASWLKGSRVSECRSQGWGSLLSFLVLNLAVVGCTVRAVQTREIAAATPRERILIATESSEFKDRLTVELIRLLDNGARQIRVIDLGKLRQEDLKRYNAVFISNTCMAWSPDPAVESLLKSASEKEKIVLLTTAGGGDCHVNIPGIDAISSASTAADAPVIAHRVAEELERVLRSKP